MKFAITFVYSVSSLKENNASKKTTACIAIGEMARCGPLPLPDGKLEEKSAVHLLILSVLMDAILLSLALQKRISVKIFS